MGCHKNTATPKLWCIISLKPSVTLRLNLVPIVRLTRSITWSILPSLGPSLLSSWYQPEIWVGPTSFSYWRLWRKFRGMHLLPCPWLIRSSRLSTSGLQLLLQIENFWTETIKWDQPEIWVGPTSFSYWRLWRKFSGMHLLPCPWLMRSSRLSTSGLQLLLQIENFWTETIKVFSGMMMKIVQRGLFYQWLLHSLTS